MATARAKRIEAKPLAFGRSSDFSSEVATDVTRVLVQALGLPFDYVRAMHAASAQAGLIQKSMLESRDFERTLASLERFALGLWARRA
jgi:hypothetical protein